MQVTNRKGPRQTVQISSGTDTRLCRYQTVLVQVCVGPRLCKSQTVQVQLCAGPRLCKSQAVQVLDCAGFKRYRSHTLQAPDCAGTKLCGSQTACSTLYHIEHVHRVARVIELILRHVILIWLNRTVISVFFLVLDKLSLVNLPSRRENSLSKKFAQSLLLCMLRWPIFFLVFHIFFYKLWFSCKIQVPNH